MNWIKQLKNVRLERRYSIQFMPDDDTYAHLGTNLDHIIVNKVDPRKKYKGRNSNFNLVNDEVLELDNTPARTYSWFVVFACLGVIRFAFWGVGHVDQSDLIANIQSVVFLILCDTI